MPKFWNRAQSSKELEARKNQGSFQFFLFPGFVFLPVGPKNRYLIYFVGGGVKLESASHYLSIDRFQERKITAAN